MVSSAQLAGNVQNITTGTEKGTRTVAPKTVTVNGTSYPLATRKMPSAATPQAEWLAISPEVMKEWLKWNRSNRNLRPNVRDSHAADMANEDWGINGEALKLSRPLKEGEVEGVPAGSILFLDGQHRGEACIKSGKPFVTLVVYGLEPESRRSMDTGLSRNMGDVLKMEGETLSPVLASVLRRVWMWDQGDRRFTTNRKPTHAELLKLFQSDPQGFRCAADKGYWVRKTYRDLPPAVTATAWYLLSRVSKEDAPWFFSSLKTGAELPENHPILILRNRLARERAEKRPSIAHHQLAMIIYAWNAYRKNQPLKRLDQAIDDATPDPL
jgi:hypothetical protein